MQGIPAEPLVSHQVLRFHRRRSKFPFETEDLQRNGAILSSTLPLLIIQ